MSSQDGQLAVLVMTISGRLLKTRALARDRLLDERLEDGLGIPYADVLMERATVDEGTSKNLVLGVDVLNEDIDFGLVPGERPQRRDEALLNMAFYLPATCRQLNSGHGTGTSVFTLVSFPSSYSRPKCLSVNIRWIARFKGTPGWGSFC